MEKAILIKAESEGRYTYKWFNTSHNVSKQTFTKHSKGSMIGFDSLRVIDSRGWDK